MTRTPAAAAILLSGLTAGLSHTAPAEAGWRNGMRFDQGVAMTERAPGAPAELERAAGAIGQYDVEVTTYPADGQPAASTGHAEITFINRGHALMESFFGEDVGGHPLASVSFLGFNPGSGRWFLAGADSWSESAWVADGDYEEGALVLTDTRRPNGGIGRTEVRYTFVTGGDGSPRLTVEESADGGTSWTPVERRVYTRRPPDPGFLAPASRYGSPRPDRPAEAAAFDFLIGEWTSSHDMTFPNGQRARWQAHDTGVWVLDGAAVLEYNWFDVDPSWPDAATTILRIYNRGMRRWECLYMPNRGHGILNFGGVEEGERIVLTNFGTDAAAPTMSRYVFHGIEADRYSWYRHASTDRGATWEKTWLIQVERKPPASETAPAGGTGADDDGPDG